MYQIPLGKQIDINQAAHLLQALSNLGLKFQIRQYQINTECDHDLCHYCVIGVASETPRAKARGITRVQAALVQNLLSLDSRCIA